MHEVFSLLEILTIKKPIKKEVGDCTVNNQILPG
jgi:hypothetical protein